jgi:ATP-dependent DNA helicase RecG
MKEGVKYDKKRLDIIIGNTANWKEVCKDCVCFANSQGGYIAIGIANDELLPPAAQTIHTDLPAEIRKRVSENTLNVGINVEIVKAENGGSFLLVEVMASTTTIASTSDGKYYYRSDDRCMPVLPEDLSRLFTDKPSYVWETQRTSVPLVEIDIEKWENFRAVIRTSSRTSQHVKNMSDGELFDRYLFTDGGYLTNLGVLWIGRRRDRARL